MTRIGLLCGALVSMLAVPRALPYPTVQPRPHPAASVELKIAAADELSPALTELAEAFEKKTGKHIDLTFADSASLSSQIRKGATFDAFFPADIAEVRRLSSSGVTMGLSVTEYARNGLVLCVSPMVRVEFPREHPLAPLKNKIIARIAIPDPHRTPSGRAALEAIEAAHVLERRKLWVGEDVPQTAQRVQSGEADVALLPVTAECSSWAARAVPIPPNLYRPITMGAAVVTRSTHHQETYAFLRFAASPAGKAIFGEHGFSPLRTLSARSR